VGQAVTFTATVAVVAPGDTAPAGTVAFLDGATPIAGCAAAALDAGGHATCTTDALTRAAHAVVAGYSGADETAASSSSAVIQHVERAVTTVSMTVAAGPSDPGEPVALAAVVAVVAPGAGMPSGTVAFRAGATVLATRPLDASGVAALSTAALPPGVSSLQADYAGSDDYAAATSAGVSHRVRFPTTVDLSSSADPALPGRAVHFDATVTSAAGAPDGGTVQFRLDGVDVGAPVAVDPTGRASSVDVVPPAPSATVTASFTGTALFASSHSDGLRQRVALGHTTTDVTVSPAPSPYGAPVTVRAQVGSTSGIPDGTVTFRRGATVLGTAPLDGTGVATLAVPGAALGAVGGKSILATYSGSASYGTSRGTRLHSVRRAGTEITLVASADPSRYRAAVTFTATVRPVAPGAGGPTGTVTFRRGATVLGTARLDGAGRARFVVSGAALGAPGVKSIQAAYGGTAAFGASTRAVLHTIAR
jgi:hypothetical protein